MDTLSLKAQPRETGKKAARAARKDGLVPCVLYGPSTEPVHFAVPTLALRPLIHTTATYRVAIALDGAEHEAIVKEIAYHPVTDAPVHVDFLALTRGEALTLTVPINLVGEAAGVLAGGELAQPLLELEIRALPRHIPGSVEVDVAGLEIGDTLHVSDLPEIANVEVLTDSALTVVTVSHKKADEGLEAADAAAVEAAADAAQGDAAQDDAAPESADAEQA